MSIAPGAGIKGMKTVQSCRYSRRPLMHYYYHFKSLNSFILELMFFKCNQIGQWNMYTTEKTYMICMIAVILCCPILIVFTMAQEHDIQVDP